MKEVLRMPNLVGLDVGAATQMLNSFGFQNVEFQPVIPKDENSTINVVYHQSVQFDTDVKAFDPITVYYYYKEEKPNEYYAFIGKDTLVNTVTGMKFVSDLVAKDVILSVNDQSIAKSGDAPENPLLGVIYQVKPISFKWYWAINDMTVGYQQEFLVKRNGIWAYVIADDLKVGDIGLNSDLIETEITSKVRIDAPINGYQLMVVDSKPIITESFVIRTRTE